MSAKHTPGPWKKKGCCITTKDGLHILEVHHPADPSRAEMEQTHADARLIAAAPNLLDVVERFVANNAHVTDPAIGSLLWVARVAIAKARGA